MNIIILQCNVYSIVANGSYQQSFNSLVYMHCTVASSNCALFQIVGVKMDNDNIKWMALV